LAILRIVLPYVVFAGLWIFLSDRLLGVLPLDAATHTQWSIYKGWAFVLVTGLLLWVLLHAELSARERARAAQRRSEEQLRLLGDNLPDSYVYQYTLDAYGAPRFLYLSSGVERLHGVTAEDVLRDAGLLHSQIAREQLPTLQAAEADSLRNLTDFAMQLRIRRSDGEWRWMQVCSRPRRASDGSVLWDGVATDVTVRMRAEEELRESEIRYRALFENSLDAVLLTVPDGRILSANQAACRMFGRTEEEICALGREAIVDAGDPGLAQLLERRESTGSVFGEVSFLRRDGSSFSGEVSSVVFKDSSGAMRTSMIIRDITERKRAEAERRRLSDIIDKSLNEIYVFDSQTLKFRHANQGALKNLHYTLEDFKDLTPVDLKPEFTETGFRAMIQPLLVHELESITFATVHRRADGSLYPVEIHLQLMDADGDRVFVAIAFDITERKRAEEEREKLRAQLIQAQKMESVGRLAGGVAHDFNNMLSVIVGHAELSLMRLEEDHPLRYDLQDILKAAQRSTELTRQLLAFARKQPVAPKVLDLNETVAEMIKMLQRLIGEDIELRWLPGGSECLVEIDPSQLNQILANLCVNARDAIAGTGRVTIETESATFDDDYCAHTTGFMAGEYVLLAVSDNGCGMDKETVDKVFEPFFTTKEMGRGTGLGLATVYGIVSQNNGFITVYSEPGMGTTFRIYLPRQKTVAFVPKDAAPGTLTGGHETILLVEDEPAILKIGRAILENLGYRVLSADTPAEAVRLAEEHGGQIRLLLTDVIMPQMNGSELSQKLQNLIPGLACLFMSGYTADIIARRGVLEEGVHFIQKPFSPQVLAAKVRRILDKQTVAKGS
jgi:PAS domain S-box-containing protein